MMAQIENSFRDLLASLETAKLYATEHPIFKKSVDKTYLSLKEILRDREDLIIGIIGEELAFEKEIFFELSRMVRPAIIYLKNRGIEKIVFNREIEKEELGKFIAFLATPKDEIKTDAQDYLSLIGIKNISVGKVKASSVPITEVDKEALSILSIYESSLDRISQSLASVINKEESDQLTLKFAIYNVLEQLASRHQEIIKLTTLKRYDPATFTHLLNVSILSMFFSFKIGFSKEVTLDIGIAALFHDIGKLYISRQLIRKDSKLTYEEFSQIESHTSLGSALLLKYVDSLGILPVVVSFEHHLKYDLTGYPKLSYAKKPHIASLIVSLCDSYDALSERRGYKADYPPDIIYNLMIKGKGTSFDPELIDEFFKVMGVWPIGSIVSLNDGRIAVVVDENEDNIFAPRVEVIQPQDKREIIDLRDNEGRIKVERYLNPWREGKEFLRLISPQAKPA